MNDLPRHADVVFVGAGHNALVAAAYLLQAGRSVVLLDQMSQPGGWVRTEELGAPGFHHDRWSSMHSAFVRGPAWAELGPDLARHGLEYVTAPLATGSSLPDGGLVTERGGDVVCGVDVDEILVRDGRAAGIRTADGTTVTAGEAVIASVTPDQLYGRLLRDAPGVPAGVRAQAAGYRFRRGCFQLNLALSARPSFADPRLNLGGPHNLGRGLAELVTSVRQAEAGLLPEHPSISWHEPTAVDPTRAPEGRALARLQVLDAPHTPVGDAAGTAYGASGWTASAAEAFADRVLAEAELHVPGLTGLVLERHVTTRADLAQASPNAGPGDHAAGDGSLAQGFVQRPIPAHAGGYRTAVPGVWLIGAATWPGAGVNGTSGRAAARALIDAGARAAA
jgi:phytoene dehydrogenase-like protein